MGSVLPDGVCVAKPDANRPDVSQLSLISVLVFGRVDLCLNWSASQRPISRALLMPLRFARLCSRGLTTRLLLLRSQPLGRVWLCVSPALCARSVVLMSSRDGRTRSPFGLFRSPPSSRPSSSGSGSGHDGSAYGGAEPFARSRVRSPSPFVAR